MNPEKPQTRTPQRLMISAIALVFILPIATSWWIYYFTDIGKGNVASYGTLIEPPVSLADGSLTGVSESSFLHGKWSLVYVPTGDCAQLCRARLAELAALRLSLDRDAARVQNVIGSSGPPQTAALQQFLSTYTSPALLLYDYSTDPVAGRHLEPGNIYLIDPLGNLIMKYSEASTAEGIIRDLKRLLRYSRIG